MKPEWGSWFKRYRHLAVLTLVVALVVWLPRIHGGSGSHLGAATGDQTSTGGNGPAGGSSLAGSPAGGAGSAVGTGAGAAGPAGGAGSGPASVGGAGSGGSGRTSASAAAGTPGGASGSAAGFPGVDTAAALANPMCDPVTRRMRVPSTYAAPCVAAWPAGSGNGGSTYAGVTKTTIELVAYFPSQATTSPPTPAQQQQYEAEITNTIRMFTDHYELWGRRIHIDFYQGTGTDETSQNADAIQVLDQFHPFAVTTIGSIGSASVATFDQTIAAHGVIDWAASVDYNDAQDQAGFRWAYNPDDRMYALEIGEFVGKDLAGRPATWAGDALFQNQTRKFGLIYDSTFEQLPLLQKTLATYGGRLADTVSYNPDADDATLAQDAATQIVKFKAEGINNIIALTNPTYTTLITDEAASQDFHPEWTVTGWGEQDTTIEADLYNQSEWSHAFGIGPVPPLQEPTSNTEYMAMYRWQTGASPSGSIDEALIGAFYLFAKDFALGLQDAGPDLTPTTFRNALFSAPPTGGRWCLPAPGCFTHEGMTFGTNLAGYPGDKYVDNSDFAMKWWDEHQSGEDEVGVVSPATWQVLYGGERFTPGSFPSSLPPMFNPSDATASYTALPKADAAPSYPRPSAGEPASVYH